MGRKKKGMGPKGFFAFQKFSNSRSKLQDIGGIAQPYFQLYLFTKQRIF
jgi:hypothetical protein